MNEDTNHIDTIPELQKIADYLEQMKFKTQLIGGCNQEDVLGHFQAVSTMYEETFERLQCENEKQAKKIEELQNLLAEERAQSFQKIKGLEEDLQYIKENDSISGKKEELLQKLNQYADTIIDTVKSLKK